MKVSEMKNIFFVYEDGALCTIRLMNIEKMPFIRPTGSYNVLKARLFGLDYAEFLRMARDVYGATLIGQSGYIIEKFSDRNNASRLCTELNFRVNRALEEIV